MNNIEIASINTQDNINSFKPSTQDEILAFNPKIGDKFEIEVLDTCPFTLITNISLVVGYVKNEMNIQGTSFEFYFLYTNNYGLDFFCIFEKSKIIKKLKGD